MDNRHDEFEKLFRDKLAGYEAAPPADAFGKVAAMARRRRMYAYFYRSVLAVLLTLLVAVSALFWYRSGDAPSGASTKKAYAPVTLAHVRLSDGKIDRIEDRGKGNGISRREPLRAVAQAAPGGSASGAPARTGAASGAQGKPTPSTSGTAAVANAVAESDATGQPPVTPEGSNQVEPQDEQRFVLATDPTAVASKGLADMSLVAEHAAPDSERLAAAPQAPKDTNKKKLANDSPWAVQVYAAPTFSYNRVATNQDDQTVVSRFDQSPGLSTDNMGVSFGLNVSRPLLDKTPLGPARFYAGAGYSFMRKSLTYSHHNATPDHHEYYMLSENQMHVVPVHTQYESTSVFRYHAVGLNTGLMFRAVEGRKVVQHLRVGFGANAFASSGSDRPRIAFGDEVQASFTAGWQVAFPLQEKLSLTVEPQLNYYFGTLSGSDGVFEIQPYTVGLQVGLQFD